MSDNGLSSATCSEPVVTEKHPLKKTKREIPATERENNVELEKLKLNVEVWKKIVDVQQHFNDLEMKVRNFGLLVVSAFISAVGVSLKSPYDAVLFGHPIPVAAILAIGAWFIWMLVFFVDVFWYHPLLKGAVAKGTKMEEQLEHELPNINLTVKIGEESATDILFFKKVRSTAKAKFFYWGISAVLGILAVSLLFFTDDRNLSQPLAAGNIVDMPVSSENKNSSVEVEAIVPK